MGRLIAIDLAGGPAFVDALTSIWDAGDAALPLDQRVPEHLRRNVVAEFGASAVITEDGQVSVDGGWPTADGDALVIATSGSTGRPKGAVLTHAGVEASARATSARLGITEDDHWLACLPLAHVGGLSVVTRALHTGTRLTVIPGFDAEAVASSDATRVALVATAMGRTDTSRFRTVLLGGARPPADRPANTVTTYGMTETGSGVVYDGYPLDGVEIRVVDGEIQLRAPMLLRCYRDGTDPRTTDGWFPTGDLGTVAEDGRLTVEGRRGDVIVTGAEKVWPDDVEPVLAAHPDVIDVAVNGTPDREWGSIVTAHVVTTRHDLTLIELRDHARDRLPGWALPRKLVTTDAIPRTALGKVRRNALG